MNKPSRVFLLIGFIIITVLLVGSMGFRNMGLWLSENDEIIKSDAIVVLSGDPARALFAAEIYNKKYAPNIFVSKPVRQAHLKFIGDLEINKTCLPAEKIYHQILLKKGVPEKNIHFFGSNSSSTVEEAMELSKTIEPNIKRIIVVTSPYHVRRTRIIFKDVLTDCEIIVVKSPYIPFTTKWWKEQSSALHVIEETIKLVFYLTGGRFYSEKLI